MVSEVEEIESDPGPELEYYYLEDSNWDCGSHQCERVGSIILVRWLCICTLCKNTILYLQSRWAWIDLWVPRTSTDPLVFDRHAFLQELRVYLVYCTLDRQVYLTYVQTVYIYITEWWTQMEAQRLDYQWKPLVGNSTRAVSWPMQASLSRKLTFHVLLGASHK